MVKMEVCANSLSSALAAEEGGAARVELCDNLAEGGTTPSYAQIAMAKKSLSIEVYPIIRPRGGDFLYNALELALMKEDIRMCKSLGCDGVVFGILTAEGRVDIESCAALVELARPMKVTFHRAFDMTRNLFEALEDIISLGCDRILTSGGEASAISGAAVITKLIAQANGRIIIMPGAGINPDNIADLIEITHAKEFHASAKSAVESKMIYRNQRLNMGSEGDEFRYDLTDSSTVSKLIKLANSKV